MPQATRSLRPNMTAGIPAYAIPATLNDPPHRWTSCQHETAANAICGSLATSGFPESDFAPATTQLLLPVCSSNCEPTGALPPLPLGEGWDEGTDVPCPAYASGGRMLASSASAVRNPRYSSPSPSVRFASSGMTITGNRPVRYQRNSPAIA